MRSPLGPLPPLAALCCVFLATPLDALANVTFPCFRAADDADGDGYARAGAASVDVTGSKEDKLSCPSGYVRYADDCDDTRASVHPYTPEIAFNGRDDDCREGPDQVTFDYSSSGYSSTTSGFQLVANVNDAATYLSSASLFAEVTTARLAQSATQTTWPKVRVTSVGPYSTKAVIPVSGLLATSVYRAKVKFHKREVRYAAGYFYYVYTPLGGGSDWYYTTTDGTADLSRTRTKIVLRGLHEHGEQLLGRVGYRGTVSRDGTRYGASLRELWCSEFYAWVTKPWLMWISGVSSVDGLVSYFNLFGSYYDPDRIDDLGKRGDYLPLDTDDDGKKNHSAMFLAHDTSNPTSAGLRHVWTLEGNHGNRVGIVRRDLDDGFRGLGHITSAM